MRNFDITLTKTNILNRIAQEDIFAKYLQIDVHVIQNCITYGRLIRSPFRDNDKNKSCGFTYNNKGKLKCRDFGGYFWGDCFDLVKFLLNKNYNVEVSFVDVLKHISCAFSNKFYSYNKNEREQMIERETISKMLSTIRHEIVRIDVETRPFNKDDVELWNKWGISISTLNTEFVYAVNRYYIQKDVNPKERYTYTSKDRCYCFLYGGRPNGVKMVKLYHPDRSRDSKEPRFITNSSMLGGMITLCNQNYDIIVLCKSTKDRLAMLEFYSKMKLKPNVGFVCLPSESHRLTVKEYSYLKNKLNPETGILLNFPDFDGTGRKCARFHYETYGIEYIFLTNGQYGTTNYDAKDFAELVEQGYVEIIEELIYKILNYYGFEC